MAFKKESLAENIYQRRVSLHMSQTELAERSGTSPDQISHYEKCDYSPGVGNLYAIAEALGCTPNDLCGWGES